MYIQGISIIHFLVSTFQYYNQKWIAHLVPIEIVPFEKMSFLDARIYIKNNRYIPTSDFNIDYMMKRDYLVQHIGESKSSQDFPIIFLLQYSVRAWTFLKRNAIIFSPFLHDLDDMINLRV